MKRCEFFIIYNTDAGKTALKAKGYMFEKYGHWFTVRHRMPSENYKKWIISDFVTGLVMTSTESRIEGVRNAIQKCSVDRLLGFYRNNKTVGMFGHSSMREVLQQYAQMIHAAMFKDNPKSKMLDLHQSQSEELFN